MSLLHVVRSSFAAAAVVVSSAFALFGEETHNVYFGNLHAHTSYNDGSGTPKEAFLLARNHLNFLAITEHNHRKTESGADSQRKDGILIAKKPSLYGGSDYNQWQSLNNKIK